MNFRHSRNMEEQNQDQRPVPAPAETRLVISSRKKWLWLGILVAAVNPIFAGLIIGAVYLSEPELQKEGRIVAAIAILWGAALFFLIRKNISVAPFTF